MTIIGTFPATIANGQVEDATVVMSLFSWTQAQTNGNACPATVGTLMLKGDGFGGTTGAAAGTDYVSPTALSAPTGSSLVGFQQSVTGALGRNTQSKLCESVSVFDFMTAAQILAVQTASGLDVLAACQTAMDNGYSVYFPPGIYYLSAPLLLRYQKQCIYGAGPGVTEFRPTSGFTSATVGGQTRNPLIWYQPTAGTWNVNTNNIIGGVISDVTLNCGYLCNGIVFNRIIEQQMLTNVHIFQAFNGIDNLYGWCHTYNNVFIQGATVISITLGVGCNGTSMTGCFLFGWNFTTSRTQIHIDVQAGSNGNSFTGGAIEICDVGVRCVNGPTGSTATIAITGTDFEEVNYRFVEVFGYYIGSTLMQAGGTTSATGCTFVGVPNDSGLWSSGASLVTTGNTFLNNGSIPTQYALSCPFVGQAGSALLGTGISSINNTFFGWGDPTTGQCRTGNITTTVLGLVNDEDVRVTLHTWTPVLAGWTTTGTVTITNAQYVKMGSLINFYFTVNATTITTASAGGSTVTGLPYAPSSNATFCAMSGSLTASGLSLIHI